MEASQRETATKGAAVRLINLNTFIAAGGKMNSESGSITDSVRNRDARREFESIMGDERKISVWKRYIGMMIKHTVIHKYETLCTVEDILGDLKIMIYSKVKVWDKKLYPEFKDYMRSNIWNIMKNKCDRLNRRNNNKKIKYDKIMDEGEGNVYGDNRFHDGETFYTVKPKNHFNILNDYAEPDIDKFENDDVNKEEEFDDEMNTIEVGCDRRRFNDTVLSILNNEKDEKLLVVYKGLMVKETRSVIAENNNMSVDEYDKIFKKLKYKLRNELSSEFRNIF
jgi:hypothetical protein